MWSDFRLALGEFNGKLLETVDTAEGTPSGALARTSREDTIKAIVKVSSSQFATPADWAASLPGTLGSEVLKTLEEACNNAVNSFVQERQRCLSEDGTPCDGCGGIFCPVCHFGCRLTNPVYVHCGRCGVLVKNQASFFRTVDGVNTSCDSCFTKANVDFAGAGEKSVLSLKQPTRRLAARVFCNGWNAWVHHDCAQFVQGLRTTSMGDTYKSFDKQDVS